MLTVEVTTDGPLICLGYTPAYLRLMVNTYTILID